MKAERMREGKGGETDLNQHSNTKWCLICRATIGPSKSIPYKHFLYILEQKMRQRKEMGKVEGIGFYPLIHVPNDHKSLGLGQNRARGQELLLGLLHGWWGPKNLGHLLVLFQTQQ